MQHQIDVLTEQFDGERQLLTAIECKYARKKVDKEIVMKLSQTMQDSGITSGIIVCKAGFTRDAVTFAEHQGIKLAELRVANENDEHYNKTVEIGTLDINMPIMVSRANVTGIDFGNCTITIRDQNDYLYMYYTHLRHANGKSVPFDSYLKAFAEEVHNRGELLKTITKDFPLSDKLFWKLPDKEIAVEKIAITGFFAKIDMSTKKSLLLTDQVWLIMKDLFDKRNLTLSKSGLIWNLPSDN
ncbi:restriction endonuclease [Mucilaginibacter sp.]|uniref:restriction endonuclease n=1 Tax=Mucilaginibacter sp. TaxID=1882438 RepID=UPI0035BC2C00